MNSVGRIERWKQTLIIFILAMTLYHIAPTVLYYIKPIKKQINELQANAIIESCSKRVLNSSKKSESWIDSFLKGLNIKPKSIQRDVGDLSLFHLEFQTREEADLAAQWIEYAAYNSIFDEARRPAVMKLEGTSLDLGLTIVTIPSIEQSQKLFHFFKKNDNNGFFQKEYVAYIGERFLSLVNSVEKGLFISEQAATLSELFFSKTILTPAQRKKVVDPFIQNIYNYVSELNTPAQKPLLDRIILSSLYNIAQKIGERELEQGKEGIAKTAPALSVVQKKMIALLQDRVRDVSTQQENKEGESFSKKLQTVLQAYEKQLIDDSQFAKQKKTGEETRDLASIQARFESVQQKNSEQKEISHDPIIYVDIESGNPFFQRVQLNLLANRIELVADETAQKILKESGSAVDQKGQFIHEELLQQAATIGRANREEVFAISPGLYAIPFFSISEASGFIQFSPALFAEACTTSLLHQIERFWDPKSADLDRSGYSYFTAKEFQSLSSFEEKQVGLLLFSPASKSIPEFDRLLKPTSFYVIARGAQSIIESSATKESKAQILQELQDLATKLSKHRFISYSGQEIENRTGSKLFNADLIFELEEFYHPYLLLTQEQFTEKGTAPILECTTLENRLRIENQIDDREQEALIRSKEMWQSAQVSPNPQEKIIAPKPKENLLWANFKKNLRSYIRGDYNRVLRLGLDLSGGKSVKIGLYDGSYQPITDQKELQKASLELYERFNGMGVSERVIRVENDTISIDFPGSQEISSSELIQASSLSFHIANEKFGARSKKWALATDEFLQEVWNEALLTNRKNLEDINAIASKKLQEARSGREGISEYTKSLAQEGLDIRSLQDPQVPKASSSFEDTLSTIVWYKRDEKSLSQTQMKHPLLIVFRNYALKGANLSHVHPSFDPTRGNILSFQVKTKDESGDAKINPQEVLYNWTSRFAPEGIQKTMLEDYSNGRGWHMAVVLNGSVISAPDLSVAIRDSACISGTFSQREVQRLARDIQTGSLSYTPKILSEYNVSPELGEVEWQKGVFASTLALFSIIIIMILYYRFAGIVASIAVIVNILIIWAIMQNIDAAMTLPSLAGIVLTVGMAIDANVLVFERIREELESGIVSLSSAIQNGYHRALSAIIDSNLTTLIAAFILTRFDSGPIRGFAITLIIGVLSSMCTSLFMTKVYFTRWIQKHPGKKNLSMASWIPTSPNYRFSKYTSTVVLISGVIFLFGALSFAMQYRSIFGMDFTGGYALVVDLENIQKKEASLKERVSMALQKANLQIGEYQIRELGVPHLLRIQLSSSLDQAGKPFFKIDEQQRSDSQSLYPALQEKNPRIEWVLQQLYNDGIVLSESEVAKLPSQWSVISGQFSSTMRNNAIYALCLSLLAILIYIAIRFEWKYAVSSVLALVHDLFLTIASIGILSWFGVNIQFNLEVIGALMTIIGYSLNDTIIVFDRVRDERAVHEKSSFQGIVDHSLNSTLSRTLLTSSTTLAVLLMLVLFGGHSIFAFSLVMFIGILLGTISSLFVAAPLLVYFDRKEELDRLHES